MVVQVISQIIRKKRLKPVRKAARAAAAETSKTIVKKHQKQGKRAAKSNRRVFLSPDQHMTVV
ncbi:hypothetical protein Pvag_3164 [Pantoea vagans C9-1]|nr:hypothetical protein Pvag_3164 [Pantoea vagans C9-1]